MRSKTNDTTRPKKKGRVGRITLLIAVPLLILLLIYVFLPVSTEVYTNTDSISDAIHDLQPRVVMLDGIIIKKQPDAVSCGITTVAVMSNYFNQTDQEVNDLIDKYDSKGNTDAVELLQRELPGRNVVFKANVANDAMIRDIHSSLIRGNPVMVFFGAPNPYNEPYYDTHGSVVYGIDLDSETITIANSYGYSEEISLVDFLNRMAYAERDRYTFGQRFVWKFIRVNKNMYVVVE